MDLNVVLLAAAIFGTVTEVHNCMSALRLLRITDPILKHGISISHMKSSNLKHNFMGINDLGICLMLAKMNFASTNPIFSMCLRAEKLAIIVDYRSKEQQETDEKAHEGTSGRYLRQLAIQVLWKMSEGYDKEVENILNESNEARALKD